MSVSGVILGIVAFLCLVVLAAIVVYVFGSAIREMQLCDEEVRKLREARRDLDECLDELRRREEMINDEKGC